MGQRLDYIFIVVRDRHGTEMGVDGDRDINAESLATVKVVLLKIIGHWQKIRTFFSRCDLCDRERLFGGSTYTCYLYNVWIA